MTEKPAETYADLIHLKTFLSLQPTFADSHDSNLFVIVHQVKELWLKLMHVELAHAIAQLEADRTGQCSKTLARVKAVLEQMVYAWSTLATLTPPEFNAFRFALGNTSGFQSYGYRKVEFILGQKDPAHLKPHRHDPEILAELEPVLRGMSLYDAALRFLSRRGLAIPPELLERDWSVPYRPHDAVRAAWRVVYEDTEGRFEEYELAEKLIDIEYQFQLWRYKHLKTVERIIGFKRGTGGSAGVPYLRQATERYFYPELWQVRTELEG